jgi:hypothetical protein
MDSSEYLVVVLLTGTTFEGSKVTDSLSVRLATVGYSADRFPL